MTRFAGSFITACAAALWLAASASAQPQGFTGYELALSGTSQAAAARTTRLRGVAYRVRGLAELVPFEGPVRARFLDAGDEDTGWTTVRSDASGAFELEVPLPERASPDGARIELEVGPSGQARAFEVPIGVRSPYDVMLRTDRQLYEPGEPVHVWALVRDLASGRPVAGQPVTMSIAGEPIAGIERTVRTSESGVAELDFELARDAPEGNVGVAITLGPTSERSTTFRVGTRTWERLLARVHVSPDEVAPNAMATARVEVTTASGAPVRDAEVVVTVGPETFTATTQADGTVDVPIHAPAYLTGETGFVAVRASIRHPAHGSVEAYDTLRLAVPLALSIELVPRHASLVPELDDVVYVRARDGAGNPPPAGTEIELESPAVRGGRALATTDENGLAEVPVRLPLGASSSADGRPTTTFVLHVRGPLERLARIAVPVAREPEVLPSLARSVLAPGDHVEVALARRASAMTRTILVELVDQFGEPLAVARAAPRAMRVGLDLPRDRIGLFTVRARAIHEDESLEGVGGDEAIIVRPAQPGFVRLEPERERWTIGETARVRLHTPPGAPRSFAAVLVRDLAAHGGEQPFRRTFLEGAFDRAILDPSGPSAERLVHAALAAWARGDAMPPTAPALVDALGLPEEGTGEAMSSVRSTLRDPWPLARELGRRGVGPAMQALEQRLEEALASGGLDALTGGAGSARDFRDEPLEGFDTLGGAPLTPSILERAVPSFTYEHVARRVARARLVRLMTILARYLDPGEDASPRARMAAEEPWARWLPRMVERGLVAGTDLDDPWGGRFALRETAGAPLFALSPQAARLELVSPGPDGRLGTSDDVRDPFARVVPAGTPYAVSSGEDALMRQLAILSPTERTLAAIAEAYQRTNAEVMEEEIGDAVAANVSEGTIGLGSIGTIGHGAGGGGSGYGSGAGYGMAGRSASAPSIRVGAATVSGLARVVRERFPPTLLFRPSVEVDPSGTTELTIPLADAVTTYVIEAIVWREDGWIWSNDARIEVDRDIVIDAPVPEVARAGDRLHLPLRVSNRSDREREVRVSLLPEPALGVAGSEPRTVRVGAGDATVVPVEVALDRVGEGRLSVVVTTPEGEALDAVRRPMRVLAATRRVHVERDTLAAGEGTLELVVPEGADARRGRVRLAVGLAMLPAPEGSPWAYWAPGSVRVAGEPSSVEVVDHAFALGAAWRVPGLDRDALRSSLATLTTQIDSVERDESDPARSVRVRALSLIGLAPLRDEPRESEGAALLDRLARGISADAVGATDDPETWVTAAAALGWTAPDASQARVAELVRRLDRYTVSVGEDRWLPTAQAPLRSTVLLAMAELSLGRRDRAFALLRTLAHWASLGHALPSDVRALARATADRLMGGEAPTRAVVELDGERHEVALADGAGELDAPALARPGRHVVRVTTRQGAPLWARADADYGIAWDVRPPNPGPLALRIEGEVGGLDEVSELELVVRNRAPRTLPRPVVEIDLPTGAELTEHDRARLGWAVRGVERGDGVMTLRLAPLRPGNEVRIALPLRWSVAGRLMGLGTTAYAADRRDDVTVLAPRALDIAQQTEGAR